MINLEKYAEALNTTVGILKSKSRKHEYVILRQVIWKHLVKENTLVSIGRVFNRSHASISQGIDRVTGLLDIRDPEAIRVNDVIDKCK